MSYLDEKYFNMLSPQLNQPKPISLRPFVVNFGCPYCGDGRHGNRRAYVYEREEVVAFYCHNCGVSLFFDQFLGEQSSALYQQYKLESLKNKGTFVRKRINEDDLKFEKVKFATQKIKLGTALSACKKSDEVLQYALERKIPKRHFDNLFSVDSFTEITSQVERYKHLGIMSPALVIPFYDPDKNYSYVCCRLLAGGKLRYLTLELDEEYPKLWGLQHIDWSKTVYVQEGPIDAMCLDNTLALAGSRGTNALSYIDTKVSNRKNVCFVFDNEIYTNRDINRDVQKRINEGYSVVLYDRKFPAKDANEAIVHFDMTRNDLIRYYKSRSFFGPAASLEFSRLSKRLNRI